VFELQNLTECDSGRSLTRLSVVPILGRRSKQYERLWSHLSSEKARGVYYEISRDFVKLSAPPRISLRWPSMESEWPHGTVPNIELADLEDGESSEGINVEFRTEKQFFEISPEENATYFCSLIQAPEWLSSSISTQRFDVAEHSTSLRCFERIKSWISKCESSHTECSIEKSPYSAGPKRLLQITFIGETLAAKLVEAFNLSSEKYIALSHCWGQGTLFRTTCKNLQVLETSGIAVSCLPKTFQDAIDISWRLGFRHLWIDSLCIVQDDTDEWAVECPKMGAIYGNAHLVISASLAKSSDCGCYGYRSGVWARLQASSVNDVTILTRKAIDHDIWQKDEPSWQLWDDTDLPLFHRAWAFQERLLARRVVHYTPQELVWECESTCWCECGQLDRTVSNKGRFPTLKSFKARYAEVVKYGSDRDRLELWLAIIDQYQSRQLTFPSDRLLALSAVAEQISHRGLMGLYVAGMWADWLMPCLLWWSDPHSCRTKISEGASHRRSQPPSAPTWSWLSVEGPVSTWGLNPQSVVKLKEIRYKPETENPYGLYSESKLVLQGQLGRDQIIAVKQAAAPEVYKVQREGDGDTADLISDTNPLEIKADLLP
jgi:Heterokaryon incompatibility protein (HET)